MISCARYRSLFTGLWALSMTVPHVWGQATSDISTPAQQKAGVNKNSPTESQRRQADETYLTGVKQLDRGEFAAAEASFAKAATLFPTNTDYAQAAVLARQHRVTELVQQSGQARIQGQPAKAAELLATAQKLDPSNPLVLQRLEIASTSVASDGKFTRTSPRSSLMIAGPIELLPLEHKETFQITADSQQVIRQVLTRFGVQPFFDESVQSKNLRFNLEDATYAEATAVLFTMAGVFSIPLDAHRVLIARDSTENRDRLERQLQETIYLPGMTTAQMNEMNTMVRSVFDVKQASLQTGLGSLALRAPEDTLNAVNLTLADLLDGGPEVVLDIRIYMVDRTQQRNIGTQLPQQIGVYNVASEATNLVNSNQDLVNQAIAQGLIPPGASDITIALALISSGLVSSSLLSNTLFFFGGGITSSGVNVNSSATFNLALSASDTRVLDSILLRLKDREAGTFRSGQRFPIVTATYSSGVAANASSLAGTTINGVSASSLINQLLGTSGGVTIPQFQYEDLGLTLKATPTVQRSGLVRMNLDLKIEALAGTSVNNIPILANRQYVSDITVKDGETTLIASSLSRTESAAISGIPGLSDLPGFQPATTNRLTETDSSELVLLVTPHVIRHRSNESMGPRIAYSQRLPN